MFKLQKQQGSAAIITIMAVMLLATIGGFFTTLTSSNLAATSEFQSAVVSQYAAEAGAKAVIAMFAVPTPNWNLLTAETEVFGFAAAYYTAEINPNLTDAQLPAAGEKYEVKVIGKYKKAIKVINFTLVAADATVPVSVSGWR